LKILFVYSEDISNIISMTNNYNLIENLPTICFAGHSTNNK